MDAALLPCLAIARQGSGRQPNIHFFFSDDHVVLFINACGAKMNQTPNLHSSTLD